MQEDIQVAEGEQLNMDIVLSPSFYSKFSWFRYFAGNWGA